MSRVYNTGNYTNVKYDLTAEVPRGASAKGTLEELVYIIQLLKPIRTPDCIEQLEAARKKTAEEQTNWEKDHIASWGEQVAAHEKRCADRLAALKSMDALGGALEKRDAKRNWNDDDDVPW